MTTEKKKKKRKNKVSTNQLIKIVMLAHCKQLLAWAYWECLWNERGESYCKCSQKKGMNQRKHGVFQECFSRVYGRVSATSIARNDKSR